MVRSSMPVVTLRKCDDRHVKASPDELARYRSSKDRDVFRSPMTAVPFASVIVPVGGDAVRLEWVLAGLMAQTTTNFDADNDEFRGDRVLGGRSAEHPAGRAALQRSA